jgi:hypothetical protein
MLPRTDDTKDMVRVTEKPVSEKTHITADVVFVTSFCFVLVVATAVLAP